MFKIKTSIGNFSRPEDLLFEMKYTNTYKVDIEAYYCLSKICKDTMTISEVEQWIDEYKK